MTVDLPAELVPLIRQRVADLDAEAVRLRAGWLRIHLNDDPTGEMHRLFGTLRDATDLLKGLACCLEMNGVRPGRTEAPG